MNKQTYQSAAAGARISYRESLTRVHPPCLRSVADRHAAFWIVFQMSAQISPNSLEGNSSRLTFLFEEVKAFSNEEGEGP